MAESRFSVFRGSPESEPVHLDSVRAFVTTPSIAGTPTPLPDTERGSFHPMTREDVARFVLRHEEKIRRIARAKLTLATRTAFDSEDVMSSVLRRVDQLAANGTLRPANEAELWALIKTIASNTAVSKTRLIERARILLTEDGEYAYILVRRLQACATDDEAQLLVLRMAGLLKNERARQVFLLRVRGVSHAAVAAALESSEGACRQNWMQMCRELRLVFEKGLGHA